MSTVRENPTDSMLHLSNCLEQYAKPLFDVSQINHFCYEESQVLDDSFNYLCLSTDQNLIEKYLHSDALETGPERIFAAYAQGNDYYISAIDDDPLRTSGQRTNMLDTAGYGNSFRIVKIAEKSNEKTIKVYSFETDKNNATINQYYLNNANTLHSFCDYIDNRLKGHKLSHAFMENKFTRKENDLSTLPPHNHSLSTLLNIALHLEDGKHSDSSGLRQNLTPKQKEVLHWYMKGKTAGETAEILHSSKKTVERHFEELRKKFNCYSKHQVLMHVLKNNLL